jgi:asparagine synthase (glutamine-hydrolysing)
MCNEGGDIWIVFNGEIYNYVELSDQLRGQNHIFKSQSDTEVIIHSYEDHGDNCLSLFNGMWSFAIYDERRNRLFCSRDRFGVKPFYYYHDEDRFIFASEIKAILAAGVKAEPHTRKISEYLTFSRLDIDDETQFKHIYQLPPAHYLTIDEGKVRIQRYWNLPNVHNDYGLALGKDDVAEQFYHLFYDSVKLRLRSDVPIGALLSGGLDSSAIVSIVNNIEKTEGLPVDIKTFTATYEEPALDESNYARAVTESCDLHNILVYPNIGNKIPGDLEKLIFHQDEPPVSMTAFAHWYLMNEISKHGIKVILSGQGADECLAGYLDKYIGYYLKDLFKTKQYRKMLREIVLLKQKCNILPNTVAMQLVKSLVSYGLAAKCRVYFKEGGVRLLKYHIKNGSLHSGLMDKAMDKYTNLNRELYRYLTVESLPRILHYEDRNSMAFAIEQRVPFLDYRLVEFVFSLANEQKINNGVSKIILRTGLRDVLPEKILYRYSKLGFTVPEDRWISSISELANDIFASKSFKERGYWDSERIAKLYKRQLTGRVKMGHFLWRVIACEVWHRIFIDRGGEICT